MNIQAVGNILSKGLTNEVKQNNGADFKNVLTDFIGSVNQDQNSVNKLTNDFILGDNVEIQDVMIAAEKAKTSLELLMEIRNKTIDMYKELNRIEI